MTIQESFEKQYKKKCHNTVILLLLLMYILIVLSIMPCNNKKCWVYLIISTILMALLFIKWFEFH